MEWDDDESSDGFSSLSGLVGHDTYDTFDNDSHNPLDTTKREAVVDNRDGKVLSTIDALIYKSEVEAQAQARADAEAVELAKIFAENNPLHPVPSSRPSTAEDGPLLPPPDNANLQRVRARGQVNSRGNAGLGVVSADEIEAAGPTEKPGISVETGETGGTGDDCASPEQPIKGPAPEKLQVDALVAQTKLEPESLVETPAPVAAAAAAAAADGVPLDGSTAALGNTSTLSSAPSAPPAASSLRKGEVEISSENENNPSSWNPLDNGRGNTAAATGTATGIGGEPTTHLSNLASLTDSPTAVGDAVELVVDAEEEQRQHAPAPAPAPAPGIETETEAKKEAEAATQHQGGEEGEKGDEEDGGGEEEKPRMSKAQRKAEKKRLEEEEAERQRFLASLEGERFRIHEAKRFRFWFRLFFSP
jgi:hypothetical protein